MPELSDGYSIVGLSQGNMIGRALIEFCDGAPHVSLVNMDMPCYLNLIFFSNDNCG